MGERGEMTGSVQLAEKNSVKWTVKQNDIMYTEKIMNFVFMLMNMLNMYDPCVY